MPNSKCLTILHEAESNDLYGAPSRLQEEKRVSFALNDLELGAIKSIRDRKLTCYAIAILGYFKIKPIQLNPAYKELQGDLYLWRTSIFPSLKSHVSVLVVCKKFESTTRFSICWGLKYGWQRNIRNLSLDICNRLLNHRLNTLFI